MSREDELLHLRLEAPIIAALRERAAKNRRTVTAEANLLLAKVLKISTKSDVKQK